MSAAVDNTIEQLESPSPRTRRSNAISVRLTGTRGGLGITVVGGRNVRYSDDNNFGVYIKEVTPGQLADQNGHLLVGDQLLEANGFSLVGVSNEKAVSILRSCASTDIIDLLVARDITAQNEFKRLSFSIQSIPGQSTALVPPQSQEQSPSRPVTQEFVPLNDIEEDDIPINNKRNSASSSDLTQVSDTSDASTQEGGDLETQPVHLSDVNVFLSGRPLSATSGDHPPPLPTSLPPGIEEDEDEKEKSSPLKREPSPAETSMSIAGSTVAAITQRKQQTDKSFGPLEKITFSKSSGLGIGITGGTNRIDGPFIIINKLLPGMDAAKDGRLKIDDRIVSINGESFKNLTRERALTLLTQIKNNASSYTIEYKRPGANPPSDEQPTTPPPTTLPLTEVPSLKHPVESSPEPPLSVTVPPVAAKVSPSLHSPAENATGLPSIRSPATNVPSVYYSTSTGGENKPIEKTITQKDIEKLTKESIPVKRVHSPSSQVAKKKGPHVDPYQKRLSVDPQNKFKLDKLIWALGYIGYILTDEQRAELTAKLRPDQSGKVIFADFVRVAQEMCSFKLEDSNSQTKLLEALTQRTTIGLSKMPPTSTIPSQERATLPISSPPDSLMSSIQVSPTTTGGGDADARLEEMRRQLRELTHQREKEKEMEREQQKKRESEDLLRTKRDTAIKEVEYLRELLMQKDKEKQLLQESLQQLENEHQRSQDEIALLKKQRTGNDLSKKLAVKDCELRKKEAALRRYQVATERLSQYVENCHDLLVNSADLSRIVFHPQGKGGSVIRGDPVTGNPRPPLYLSQHARKTGSSLVQEAKETLIAVRQILSVDILPHGWEEEYSEDGRKYYINHQEQVTSWVHPLTRAPPPSNKKVQQEPSPAETSMYIAGNAVAAITQRQGKCTVTPSNKKIRPSTRELPVTRASPKSRREVSPTT